MFKHALYTYRKSLHPRNLKYLENKFWIVWVFIFAFLPATEEIRESGIEAFYTVSKYLPLIMMKISNSTAKLNMSKSFFLVPMKKRERETYINYLLGIKIGVPMLFGLLLELLWSIIYDIVIVDILVTLFLYFSFGIAEYMCIQGTFDDGSKVEHGVKTKEGFVTYSSTNLLGIGMVWFLLMVCVPRSLIEDQSRLWNGIILPETGVSIIVLAMIDVITIIRQYASLLDDTCDYERAFQVQERKGLN